jgi:DNA-directed RNA polymerase specialized sigma24 family protein
MIPAIHPADEQRRMNEQVAAEMRLECFGVCLEKLDSDERQLLTDYYVDEPPPHIENRKLLAERLGITLPHLRVRVHRIREKLLRCIRDGMGDSGKLRE